MKTWLRWAARLDSVSEKFAHVATWTVLLSALISAGNALIRYGFDWSDNALLDIQWFLFAWTVLFGGAEVLKRNEHVRVDLVYARLRPPRPVWVDLLGLTGFLLPTMLWMSVSSASYAWLLFQTGDTGKNASLVLWPAAAALPLGFALVSAQGVAEIIKRIAYLKGQYAMDTHYEKPLQ